MKYTVVRKPSALQKLAGIWLSAADRDAINRAVGEIDQHLQQRAAAGEAYVVGTRLLVAPPLVVVYEVNHGDCCATVTQVVYRP